MHEQNEKSYLTSCDSNRSTDDAFYTPRFRELHYLLPAILLPEKIIKKIKDDGLGDIELDKVPFNDKETFEMLWRGDTKGVFPFNSPQAIAIMQRLPTSYHLEDLMAVLCLENRGKRKNSPMKMYVAKKPWRYLTNMVVLYVKNSAVIDSLNYDELGDEDIDESARDILHDILRDTCGLLFYQEQIEQIAMAIAGLSQSEADSLCEAIVRNFPSRLILEEQQMFFTISALENNLSEYTADYLFKYIEKSAPYCLNKTITMECAALGYRLAWCKVHYRREFDAALCSLQGHLLDVLPPALAASTLRFFA